MLARLSIINVALWKERLRPLQVKVYEHKCAALNGKGLLLPDFLRLLDQPQKKCSEC